MYCVKVKQISRFVIFVPVALYGLELAHKVGSQCKYFAPIRRRKLRKIQLVQIERRHRHTEIAALSHNKHNVMSVKLRPIAMVDEFRTRGDEIYPVATIQHVLLAVIGELRASP